jgi:hypothetical protein
MEERKARVSVSVIAERRKIAEVQRFRGLIRASAEESRIKQSEFVPSASPCKLCISSNGLPVVWRPHRGNHALIKVYTCKGNAITLPNSDAAHKERNPAKQEVGMGNAVLWSRVSGSIVVT